MYACMHVYVRAFLSQVAGKPGALGPGAGEDQVPPQAKQKDPPHENNTMYTWANYLLGNLSLTFVS